MEGETMGHGPQLTETDQIRACQLKAAGKSNREIANTIGRSPASISRLINRADSKDIIEREASRILEKLPQIIEMIFRDLDTSNHLSKVLAGEIQESEEKTILEKDITALLKFRDQTNKTISDILKAMGIYASHSPGLVVQQIYQDNRTQSLSPDILRLIGGFLGSPADVLEDEVIKIEGGTE